MALPCVRATCPVCGAWADIFTHPCAHPWKTQEERKACGEEKGEVMDAKTEKRKPLHIIDGVFVPVDKCHYCYSCKLADYKERWRTFVINERCIISCPNCGTLREVEAK